ncbi:hypothetical protein B1219_30595 [Pseudomonas ogarae]|nr:hypothetical protein B1219_30595 [Pseudomonas ogarae]OPG78954.1 hypothetical protein B1218_13000 [Pseudomonas ogarae]
MKINFIDVITQIQKITLSRLYGIWQACLVLLRILYGIRSVKSFSLIRRLDINLEELDIVRLMY